MAAIVATAPGKLSRFGIEEQVSIIERATLLLASGIIDCASENSENSFQQFFVELPLIRVSPRTETTIRGL